MAFALARRPLVARRSACVALALVAAACSSGGGPAPRPPSRPPAASKPPSPVRAAAYWPTYHGGNDRAGSASGVPAPHKLSRAWRARLDGAVYGQALVVEGTVYAATENNTVYALDLATGRRRWRRHLAAPARLSHLPCGNIDPLGITGTPAYDPATRTVFAVTENASARHTLVALDAADGRTRFSRGLDVAPGRDRAAEQERGALAVAGGRVYVTFGGLFGDCGDYVGYVTATRTDGGDVASYAVPTGREGGIWAPSGPAVDPAGNVYVAVGNGASFGGRYDGSDSVLRLTPGLTRRTAYFAPRSWGSENAADQDLGSTGPLLLPGHRALIAGKTGHVYLLDTDHLGGIGGQRTSLPGCVSFGGTARSGSSTFLPCQNGVQRIDITHGRLHRRWTASVTGSPVVGGAAIWTISAGDGRLHALSAKTGHNIVSTDVGPVSRFASPTPAGSLILAPTLAGVTAVRVN